MSTGRELFALDWVKGELLQTLGDARQALEVYAEQGRDETRMRACLTNLHQVHGTLIMLELPGVALLADYLERLAQGLLDNTVAGVNEACEVIMQGIIELPERLELIQETGNDSESAVLPLVNRAAAILGLEPVAAADTLDESVSETALARFERIDGAGKIRRIRAAYQNVLLSILKGEEADQSIETLKKVALGLERICEGAPAEAQWQAFGVFVDSLKGLDRPLPAEVVKMLRRIDAEIRRFARDGTEAFLAPVHKALIQQLLDAAAIRNVGDARADDLRKRAEFDPALDEVALSGREALASAVAAMRDELAAIKDRLDLYVRAPEREPEALQALVQPLNKLASTCSVLGFESSRAVILDQVEVLSRLLNEESAGAAPLLQVASSLVQVEENLASVGTTVEVTELQRLQGDAEKQVLAESRAGLESVKQAIVEFVSSEFDSQYLAEAPQKLLDVCGALAVANLTRPIAALRDCRAFIEQELMSCQNAAVNWERLDRFADCISGIDYYLERLIEDTRASAEDVIEVVERSIAGLGFTGRGEASSAPSDESDEAAEVVELQSADAAFDVPTEDPAVEAIVLDEEADASDSTLETEAMHMLEADEPEPSVEPLEETQVSQAEAQAPEPFDLPPIDLPQEKAPEDEAWKEELREEQVSVETAPLEAEFDLESSLFDEVEPETAQSQPQGLVGEHQDPEILEVFSEEVGEVLETLGQFMPAWRQDLQSDEPRTEVRRAFHTLKGSGRLVGAERIGELAWAVENMLNRVLDGTLDASNDILDVADEARGHMPALLEAFSSGGECLRDEVDQLIEKADVLASGGSLDAGLEAEEEGADGLSEGSEELAIFLEEVEQIVDVLKSRTGRRTVQLDDEAMMALHTLVGSASLVQQDRAEALGDVLYEAARSYQAETLRGPNVQVELARLFQDAIEYLERALDCVRQQEETPDNTELLERARQMLENADEAPAEEMLVGLSQLDVVMNARAEFKAWTDGESADDFRSEFRDGMHAVLASTSRPQVTDLARALMQAVEALPADARISTTVSEIMQAGSERLLSLVDAIAADRALPRVDDVITGLSDVATGNVPLVDETEQADAAPLTACAHEEEPLAVSQPLVVPVAPPQETPVGSAARDEDLDPELAEVFFEEAEELMEALEITLHDWNGERDNRLHLENLLRVLHTLKGSARLAGLSSTGDCVHQFESFLIDAQNAEVPVDDALIERSENQFEIVASLLANTQKSLFSSAPADAPAAVAEAPPVVPTAPQEMPEQLEEQDAQAPVSFRSPMEETAVQVVRPVQTEASDSVEVSSPPEPSKPPEQRAANQEMVRVRSALLENLVNLAGENSILRARIEQGMSDFSSALEEMETTIERTREQLRRLEIETEAQVLHRQEQLDPAYESFDPLEMDRYSQLQQLSRALSESASDMLDLKDTLNFKARESETLLLQQARINTELQEGLMRTRMVPFSRLLPRMRRTVRQISNELGKQVEFHAYNAEGELDRNLLERMVPPLEHMLRNAVDHGLEAAEVRRSFGKAPVGRIDLRLSREGGDIVIEIADDGAGIDVEAVRTKALEKGFMHAGADLNDEEVLEFVLAPGFSTAKSVTQISGRGVGLDVVNSEVKQLGGSVSISSSPGKGTRFVVRVPFTVSVNRALMVNLGDDLYAIPLNNIEGIVLLDPEQVNELHSGSEKVFEYAGVSYRVRYLGHYIGRSFAPVSGVTNVPVVLVRSGDQAIAVHVDGVQGSREIVVKSLGPQFAGVGGISGATILGDGSVVVILDLLALIRSYGREGFAAAKRSLEMSRPNPCVMVVDDSVTVRKVTARLLERQGMDVIVAKDGVEAVALLQEQRPDVMLLDIEMPRMDGFEVARQVRHDDRLSSLPIIMISSRTGSKHTGHAEELGVNRFLGKPFQENELLGAIDELVGQN